MIKEKLKKRFFKKALVIKKRQRRKVRRRRMFRCYVRKGKLRRKKRIKPVRTRKKRRVITKHTYAGLRRFHLVFNIVLFAAPLDKNTEIRLFTTYKQTVFMGPKGFRRIWMFRLHDTLSNKDINVIVEAHLSISGSNAFLTIRQGIIEEKKKKPKLREKKPPLDPESKKEEKGLENPLESKCETEVIFKLTPPLIGFGGIKKSTDYARQQLYVIGSRHFKKLNAIFLRLRINYGNVRAYRRRKVYRPLTRSFKGYVLSIISSFRRAHGFLRGKKKKRL